MMEIRWKIKPFASLTVEELYQTLQLRSEVFVVEQNCVYLDIDGKDPKSLFLLGVYKNEIVAHARLFDSGVSFENASIGRVVVHPNYRSKKWGYELMQQAIQGIHDNFGKSEITIGAQLYLKRFYESLGFKQSSEVYLEDGIEHIIMDKK